MLPRYDEWKTTDPRDAEPTFTKCPICKARHYTHERCDETEIEYEYQDREDDEQYVIICRDDGTADQPGPYILATRRVFTSRADAEDYARAFAHSREPLVVGGRWGQLRGAKWFGA